MAPRASRSSAAAASSNVDTKPEKVKADRVEKNSSGKTSGISAAMLGASHTSTASTTMAGGGGASNGGNHGEKKEKVAAVTGEEAGRLMRTYLKAQNRPYSATEVSANLHGRVTKTVADKLLKEMAEAGVVGSNATKGVEKGSQWVFWTLQDPADTASAEDLLGMDQAISALHVSIPELKARLKAETAKLQTLRATPSTARLDAESAALEEEVKRKEAQLGKLQSGEGTGSRAPVSVEEIEGVEREWTYWAQKKRVRQRCFRDLEAVLLDGMTREQIWERAGIEEEEEGEEAA